MRYLLFYVLTLACIAGAQTNTVHIVVEASRANVATLALPMNVQAVSTQAARDQGAYDLATLLRTQTSVAIRESGAGNLALAQVAARGYGENSFGRLLVLADGERLTNPDMSIPNLARLPLNAFERIEVMYGPQTVLYGDGASAGVINAVTTPSERYLSQRFVEASVGSWNTLSAAVGVREGDATNGVSARATGTWRHSDGYRGNSGYDLWNASGGVRKDWKSGSYAKVGAFYSNASYDLPGALSTHDFHRASRHAATPNDHARRYEYGINEDARGYFNDESSLRLPLNLTLRDASSYFDLGATTERVQSKVTSLQVSPQYDYDGTFARMDTHLILGVDYRYEALHGTEEYQGAYSSFSRPHAARHVGAVFTRDEWHFNEWWSAVLGARLERTMARNRLAQSAAANANEYALEAALNFHPTEDSKVFLRATRYYRNPFLDETPWYFNRVGAYVPQRLLNPERGYNLELGADWTEGEWSAAAVVFGSETTNEVMYDPAAAANINADDKVRRVGAEVRGGWNRKDVAGVNGSLTGLCARFAEGRYHYERVPLVPDLQARLGAYAYVWEQLQVHGNFQYVTHQVTAGDFDNALTKMPWYVTFSLGVGYEWQLSDNTKLIMSVDIENLFDRKYADYATYGANWYLASGRAVALRIRLEW